MDISLFTALVDQIMSNPGSLLILLAVSILGFVLENWVGVPNKPACIVCLVLGIVLYPVFVSRGTVNPNYPFPVAVLLAFGLVIGFAGAVLHATLVAAIIKKLTPASPPPPP